MSSMKRIIESEVKSIILEAALEGQTIKEHQKLVEKREDAQSLIVKEVLLHIYGPDVDLDKIDESVWSKVKNMVSKGSTALGNLFQIGKRKWEIEADRFEIEDLLQKAGKSLPAGLMKQLAAEDPDGGVFPNGEDEALFASRLNAIQFAYGLIMSGLENGVLPHESAEAGIMAMRKFLESSLDKLSSVYKTFNEEEDVEQEVIFENSLITAGGKGLFGLNFNKILQKAQNSDLATIQDTIADLTSRIAAPGSGRDEAAQAILTKLQGMADSLAGAAKTANAAAGGTAAKGAGAGAGAAAKGAGAAGVAKGGAIATTKPTLPAYIVTSKKYTFLQQLAAALGISPTTALALAGAALIGGLYLKGKISSRAAAIKKTLELLKVPKATPVTNVVPEPNEPPPAPPTEPPPAPPTEPPPAPPTEPPTKPTEKPEDDQGPEDKPEKPYGFPLYNQGGVEDIVKKFFKDRKQRVSPRELEIFLGELEDWLMKVRKRGADYYDIQDRDFMNLAEKRSKVKSPNIPIKRNVAKGSRGRSLDRFLMTYLKNASSAGRKQGGLGMFKKLDPKELAKLRKMIVKYVYDYLDKQGAPVQESEEDNLMLERWSRLAGITNKKVL